MTSRLKCHVLILAGIFIVIIFIVNLYFLHVISKEPQHAKKTPAPLQITTVNNKILPAYTNVNTQFYPVFSDLKRKFVANDKIDIPSLWEAIRQWNLNGVVFSMEDHIIGNLLATLRTADILRAENSQKGTQLKLLLTLEGGQNVLFKPKWYNRNTVIKGTVYSGKDRHNAEVIGFFLSAILDVRWVPVAVTRQINMKSIWSIATPHLRQTMFQKENGSLCMFGKCHYCRKNESVCGDEYGNLEGAVILVIDQKFTKYPSPWRRTYSIQKLAEWETNPNYCSYVKRTLPTSRILDLVDAAIFDFLLQNGDRHHYETFLDNMVLLDNGKGLGNPHKDFTDILAPLYQCCILRRSMWERLKLMSGGSLSAAISNLQLQDQGAPLLSELHLEAIDRRLLTVYSTVESCFAKFGKNILKNKL